MSRQQGDGDSIDPEAHTRAVGEVAGSSLEEPEVSAYEVFFLSLAHTPQHIERFADAFRAALDDAATGEKTE